MMRDTPQEPAQEPGTQPEAEAELLKRLTALDVKPLTIADPTTGQPVSSVRVMLTGEDALRVLSAPEEKRAQIATAILKDRAARQARVQQAQQKRTLKRDARKAERKQADKSKRRNRR